MRTTRTRAALVAAVFALSGLAACTQETDGEGPATTTDAATEPALPGEEEAGDPQPSPGPGSDDLQDDDEREDDSLDQD
jgi:hypothetical protein